MVFAHRPTASTALQASKILYTDATVPDGGLLAGSAVGIRNENDQLVFFEVGSLAVDSPMSFIGFLSEAMEAGAKAKLVTGRGSVVTPKVLNGLPLAPGQQIYLSVVPGFVTQTPPDPDQFPGATLQPIGYAVTATTMIFNTDTQLRFGG